MFIPLLKDDAMLDDIRTAASDHSNFHLWWLGQSGFMVQWQGKHLLIDPYLSDSLTRKYAHTDLPHIRMTELVIDPAPRQMTMSPGRASSRTSGSSASGLVSGRASR